MVAVPADEDLGPQLSRRLSFLLKRASVRLEALHEELLAPAGLTARELSVLLFLTSREPPSQQEAARRLGVDRTTMVALLDRLEQGGMVARVADPSDRRRNVVDVTPDGQVALDRALRASDQAERRLLAGLDADEARQLRALLARI